MEIILNVFGEMPDITMCPGDNCPLKENCYRFTAKASEYHQSYFMEAPYDHGMKDCEHYWFISNKDRNGKS